MSVQGGFVGVGFPFPVAPDSPEFEAMKNMTLNEVMQRSNFAEQKSKETAEFVKDGGKVIQQMTLVKNGRVVDQMTILLPDGRPISASEVASLTGIAPTVVENDEDEDFGYEDEDENSDLRAELEDLREALSRLEDRL